MFERCRIPSKFAEEVGFEPTEPCGSHAFQAWMSGLGDAGWC